jgi:sulfur carrier protein ThiS
MKIKVIDEKTNKPQAIEAKNIAEAANKLNINLEEVIIVQNDELVTENTQLNDGDILKFLSVISGG